MPQPALQLIDTRLTRKDIKMNKVVLRCGRWGCQLELPVPGGGRRRGWGATGAQAGVNGGWDGDGEYCWCFGNIFIIDWFTVVVGWPHACNHAHLNWGTEVIGGKPMVARAGASHRPTSRMPPAAGAAAAMPYICRPWLLPAASALRANRCFRWERYF